MRIRRWPALPLAVVLVFAVSCSGSTPPPVVSSPAAPSTTRASEDSSRIVVGMQQIAGGYNPHLLADSSTVTSVLATLLLPSVFRPSRGGKQGHRALDRTVMKSAKVTSSDPFTVSYQIRDEASWSDGAPVAAEDFIYLADAMRKRSGVANAAGYRLISDIRAGDGGKHVEVEFSSPYPGWRTLFDNLLPAHLLKDAPNGWPGALASGFPASAGPFAIKSIDMTRGEIVLERNERYWADPTKLDRIVLRRTDEQDMAAALRSGTIQLALADTDETGTKLFRQLGDRVTLHELHRPRVATLLLRPRGSELADDRVRAAVAALVDRETLIEIGTAGGPSADLHADAQVRAPSSADYRATLPDDGVVAATSQERAAELLRSAGYERVDGSWTRNGHKLTLVIATPGGREPYARMAQALAAQLSSAGIDVRTRPAKPRPLFGRALRLRAQPGHPDSGHKSGDDNNSGHEHSSGGEGGSNSTTGHRNGNGVDIALVPQEAGDDVATVLASRFGCGKAPGKKKQGPRQVRASAAAYCDDDKMQSAIRKSLTGERESSDVLDEIEGQLWQGHVTIPLFQLTDTLAVGTGITGVTTRGDVVGTFRSAAAWARE